MSWRNYRSVIRCCYGCVAPKRHVGCHATCPNYIKEKEINDENLKTEQLESNTFISAVEFEKRQDAAYDSRNYRKKKR